MKLVSLLPIASLASLGLVSAADVKFGSDTKVFATLTDTDGSIKFCPTGDCATLYTKITPTSIKEYVSGEADAAAVTAQSVTSFAKTGTGVTANAWTAGNDIPKSSTDTALKAKTWTYKTALMNAATSPAQIGTLELTATYYVLESTETLDSKTVTIPANSLVLSSKIASWTWDATDDTTTPNNALKFVWTLASSDTTKPTVAPVDATDGGYLTSIGTKLKVNLPGAVLAATTAVKVVPTLDTDTGKVVTVPIANFAAKALTYSPVVLSYTDAVTLPTVGAATNTPAPAATTEAPASTTPAPSGASSLWGYAASVVVGGAAIAAMMF